MRLRWRLILMALAGLLLLLAAGWWLSRWQERRRALSMAESGDFHQAAPALDRLLTRSPDDLAVLSAMVRGLVAGDGRERAAPLIDRWCRLRPRDPEPYRLRMDQHRRDKRSAEELADARHLLTLERNDARLRFRVAQLCFGSGDFAEAQRHCQECVDEDPRWRDARRLQAQVLLALGQSDRAATVLDQLLAEKNDDTAVIMARAILFIETGQPARAVGLLETVLRLDPHRQRTGRYRLALAYERTGKVEEARRVMAEVRRMQEAETLRFAVQSQPVNLDLLVRAAEAFLKTANTGEGLDLLGRVLEKEPSFAPAHRLLADYYQKQDQLARAAEHRRLAGQGP